MLAFITLAYGWVRGIDILLYGSIAFSALAGVALLRATLLERRKHPELSRRGRRRAYEDDDDGQKVVLREKDRKSLAELRMELSGLKGQIETADRDELYGAPKRSPLRPFSDPSDDFDILEETNPERHARSRPAQQPARAPAQNDDFRSRLSAVLGEGQAPSGTSRAEADEPHYPQGRPSRPRAQQPRPEPFFEDDDEIGTDWIRIEDVPRISRATREGGGYARPEMPPMQASRRRTPGGPASPRKAAPAGPESAGAPRRRTAAGAKDIPAKPAGSRGGASRGSAPAKRGPGTESGEPRQPRTGPKPKT